MSFSWTPWLAGAVLLFWSVGGYNRLVRLRSGVISAFAGLDPALMQRIGLVRQSLPDLAESANPHSPTMTGNAMANAWAGLRGASDQCSASLAYMRGHPLDAAAAQALSAALNVLETAWQRVLDEGQDLAGAPLPEKLLLQWQQIAVQIDSFRSAFNAAVVAYNEASVQFPALLIVSVFRFQPAGRL